MDNSWNEVLKPHLERISKILENLTGSEFFPAQEMIFRSLNLPRDSVKAIIIGQDPYPSPGIAEGVAFSVPPNIPIKKFPPSLRNIFTEYVSDLGFPYPTTGHLGQWSDNGVLLLNRILTVAPDAPLSHKGKGWEAITDSILDSLVPENIPVIAWGKPAESAARNLGFKQIVASPHPSPLSAYRGFFGSRPFTKINEILTLQDRAPINWRLN
jgi:uracil-DNA glycosylase